MAARKRKRKRAPKRPRYEDMAPYPVRMSADQRQSLDAAAQNHPAYSTTADLIRVAVHEWLERNKRFWAPGEVLEQPGEDV